MEDVASFGTRPSCAQARTSPGGLLPAPMGLRRSVLNSDIQYIVRQLGRTDTPSKRRILLDRLAQLQLEKKNLKNRHGNTSVEVDSPNE